MKKLIFLLLCLLPMAVKAQFADAPVAESDLNVGVFIVDEVGNSTLIQPIKYYKMKTGSNAFASAMTYGLAKVKNKVMYKSATSPNVLTKGSKFRFCFGDVPLGRIAQFYMIDKRYTLRNFSMCEFDVKKDSRVLETAKVSIWTGAQTGTTESDAFSFDVTMVDDFTYECSVHGEPVAGEYCFLFTDNGIGAYMSVFDFSIPE